MTVVAACGAILGRRFGGSRSPIVSPMVPTQPPRVGARKVAKRFERRHLVSHAASTRPIAHFPLHPLHSSTPNADQRRSIASLTRNP